MADTNDELASVSDDEDWTSDEDSNAEADIARPVRKGDPDLPESGKLC